MLRTNAFLLVGLAVAAGAAVAQSAPRPAPIPARGAVPRDTALERKLTTDFTAPDGFRATLFAGPPVAMYPTCVAEASDGAVFVCVDPNLSLSQLKGVGRVMRLVDEDRDGRADRYTTFVDVDSPRGAVFDGRTLYVMHPPNLTAYRDTNGDGIADESTDLVTGLGFDLDFRGADHGSNNVALGIDGWLYVAVGDYGFIKATGTDGRQLQHRGGGVVRVRPDGTQLELYATGTRNIYDVAIDPFMRLYARDNTNDGDGWDTRLHYLAPGADMGYPARYQNFPTEHFPSLHDYGAGSGVGALWIEDPTWPAGYGNTLYTGDWTLQKIFRHPLTARGAIFDVEQHDFIGVLRPADLALDGSSSLYVASLAGGEFTYASDAVGYVVRVAPRSAVAEPPVATMTERELLATLASPYAVRRSHAQQALLRRGPSASVLGALRATALDARAGAAERAAALFTLKQLAGGAANGTLRRAAAAADPRVREVSIRALADRNDQLEGVAPATFVAALADADAQVRVQALDALVRLGARDAAGAIVPLVGSADQGLAHLAVRALVALGGRDAALRAVDEGAAPVRAGALRALAMMHDAPTVTALVDRLGQARGAAAREPLVEALARLIHRDGVWRGDWWSTRPPHLGPYVDPAAWAESPRIRAALVRTLLAADTAETARLAAALARNQAIPRGGAALLVAVATPGDSLRPRLLDAIVGRATLDAATTEIARALDARGGATSGAVVALLADESAFPANALPLVRRAALDATIAPTARARMLDVLGGTGAAGLDVATDVFARLTPPVRPAPASTDPVESAWRRFVGDRRRVAQLEHFIARAGAADSAQRVLAYAVLVQSVRTPRTAPAVRERVAPVLDAAWSDPSAARSLVQAIGVMRVESQYADRLAAHRAANPAPADAYEWTPLFNGRDLDGWDVKFTGHDVGENLNDTFRVLDGLLQVRYDRWNGFRDEFGHLFYRQPFSHYIVAVEYRFVGEQVSGAGSQFAWAIRNNGVMVHSQSAASMGRDQDFPMSLEVQLLGGLGSGPRPTGNLCTPGTNVHFGDSLVTRHCTNSTSRTYDGDQWVRVEALVLGDSIVKHIVDGDTVLVYRRPEMGGGAANRMQPGVKVDGAPLASGYIALQAETAPIDFRKVEIVNLEGCMDATASNYRRYFVKSNPSSCRYDGRR